MLLLAGLGITIVGYSDIMLIARGFPLAPAEGETAADLRPDPQAELVAMAGVHAMVGVLSGYPVSASGSRTALAIASRARSQVYSLVAALCVVAVLFFAGPLMAPLPWAALGAVVFYGSRPTRSAASPSTSRSASSSTSPTCWCRRSSRKISSARPSTCAMPTGLSGSRRDCKNNGSGAEEVIGSARVSRHSGWRRRAGLASLSATTEASQDRRGVLICFIAAATVTIVGSGQATAPPLVSVAGSCGRAVRCARRRGGHARSARGGRRAATRLGPADVSCLFGGAGGVGPRPGAGGPRPARRDAGAAAPVAVHRVRGHPCVVAGIDAGPARGHGRGDRGRACGQDRPPRMTIWWPIPAIDGADGRRCPRGSSAPHHDDEPAVPAPSAHDGRGASSRCRARLVSVRPARPADGRDRPVLAPASVRRRSPPVSSGAGSSRGAPGPRSYRGVRVALHRQTLLATLLLSQGVPMISHRPVRWAARVRCGGRCAMADLRCG
jgi:hypothetical protein